MTASDVFKLITDRQTAVANEINDLSHRISVLRAELDKLDDAMTLLKSLGAKPSDPSTSRMERAAEMPAEQQAVTAGKPVGLPQMTEMINEALASSHKGMTPAMMVAWIRERYWEGADIRNVGPIAWRMW